MGSRAWRSKDAATPALEGPWSGPSGTVAGTLPQQAFISRSPRGWKASDRAPACGEDLLPHDGVLTQWKGLCYGTYPIVGTPPSDLLPCPGPHPPAPAPWASGHLLQDGSALGSGGNTNTDPQQRPGSAGQVRSRAPQLARGGPRTPQRRRCGAGSGTDRGGKEGNTRGRVSKAGVWGWLTTLTGGPGGAGVLKAGWGSDSIHSTGSHGRRGRDGVTLSDPSWEAPFRAARPQGQLEGVEQQ